jgi:hypothetical protein
MVSSLIFRSAMIAAVWFNRGADRPATSTLCSVLPSKFGEKHHD